MKRQNTRDKENQTDRVECHYTSMTHRSIFSNMPSPIKADSTRNILILRPDVIRAQSKRQLDRADVSHTCSFNK